jgi:hypothetical protein
VLQEGEEGAGVEAPGPFRAGEAASSKNDSRLILSGFLR